MLDLVYLFLFVGNVGWFTVSLSFAECSAGCEVNKALFVFLRGLELDHFIWSS